MPKWVLECPNCKFRFEHSQINDVGMALLELPFKPDLPPNGVACACPNCGHGAVYRRTDLLYRA
jgi:uncharacterized protein (DUF983 family)